MSGRTITARLDAWLSDAFGPEDLTANDANAVRRLSFFTSDMSEYGYTKVGTATVTVDFIDTDAMVVNKIASLRAEIQKTRADASVKCTLIEERIAKLSAISYDAEAA